MIKVAIIQEPVSLKEKNHLTDLYMMELLCLAELTLVLFMSDFIAIFVYIS